jgi:hypothetical protein
MFFLKGTVGESPTYFFAFSLSERKSCTRLQDINKKEKKRKKIQGNQAQNRKELHIA